MITHEIFAFKKDGAIVTQCARFLRSGKNGEFEDIITGLPIGATVDPEKANCKSCERFRTKEKKE